MATADLREQRKHLYAPPPRKTEDVTMRQLLVECSDPGLVIALAEELENVLLPVIKTVVINGRATSHVATA